MVAAPRGPTAACCSSSGTCGHTLCSFSPYAHTLCLDNKSEEGLRVFWERVLLLRKVTSGNHCHVAQLVGCIVQELPAAILVEYSAEGDLLTYLRTRRTVCYAHEQGHTHTHSPDILSCHLSLEDACPCLAVVCVSFACWSEPFL